MGLEILKRESNDVKVKLYSFLVWLLDKLLDSPCYFFLSEALLIKSNKIGSVSICYVTEKAQILKIYRSKVGQSQPFWAWAIIN